MSDKIGIIEVFREPHPQHVNSCTDFVDDQAGTLAQDRTPAVSGHEKIQRNRSTSTTPIRFFSAETNYLPSVSCIFLPYDHLDQSSWNWTAADRKLAEEMSSYWDNFARSGDPNGPGLLSWPAFANAGSKVQHLGDPITVGGGANIDTLRVFDAVYATVRGTPLAVR
jgi:hypothetical protein